MFNQRKSFFRGKLFYVIIMALFVFGIWLNAPINNNNPEEVKADTKYRASTDSGLKQADNDDYDIMENIIGKNQTSTPAGVVAPNNNNDMNSEQTDKGYYLVKEVKGIIMIFYYNEEGKETLIRDTDIAFSLLSTSDQELFRQGIIKDTPEELDELLQDFES